MARTNVTTEPAIEAHCYELAPFLREGDVQELLAFNGKPVLWTVLQALADSDFAETVFFDGDLACIWGTAPAEDMGGAASIWMLTTYAVEKHPKAFMKLVRPALETSLARYFVVYNFVDARYTKALRFAKHVGFEVMPPIPFGKALLPFCPIILRRSSLCAHP